LGEPGRRKRSETESCRQRKREARKTCNGRAGEKIRHKNKTRDCEGHGGEGRDWRPREKKKECQNGAGAPYYLWSFLCLFNGVETAGDRGYIDDYNDDDKINK
jgi:hypothetical protein